MENDNKSKIEKMAKELRLLYYNNYLFDKGIISKREHERMNLAIITKFGKRTHEKIMKDSS